MKYEEPSPISRQELDAVLSCGSGEEAGQALLRMALSESDWQWAEQKCLSLINDKRHGVRAAAITGLGHVARIHGKLHQETIVPILRALRGDPEVGGIAEDALDDISIFTTTSKP